MPGSSRKFLEIEAVSAGRDGLGGILPGRVAFRPQSLASIGTPVAARVVSVDVRPGEAVKAGAILVTLQGADVAAARASLDQAAAKAAASEDLLRRQDEMVRKGVGLEVERFAAETSAREARAELERAQRAVALLGGGHGDRFEVRAPAGGVILAVRAAVGSVVAPGGDALVQIGDPRRLWVVADVPESEIGGISAGQLAEVHVPASDSSLQAVVDGVGQVVDGEQRRLPVYLSLRGPPQRLAPGMLVEVRVRSAGGKPTVPITAVLIKDGSRRVVYVHKENGRFEPRAVRTGVSRDGRVTILEGLEPGEQVVVRGALLLDGEAEQLL
ncbi:MAG TPA: efflux RND transporter periplasmic adaptor subunit [Anaeromyxobacteraceae bacterium]|nr:efflux RND transporter periplasmic adaptor subunit [Anaeromyxobacteraceae bacterium]